MPKPSPADALLPLSDDPARHLQGTRVHFVGIGGCGMSGLARIARQSGATCTGSDIANSPTLDLLRSEGIDITLNQTAQSVPEGCDLLVVSAAIKAGHPERVAAEARGIRVLKYAQMLGQLMLGRIGIAVAGTHGKSSTTSMLAHVLVQAGLDPSVIVGANCPQIGGGARTGQSALLVAEACEFDRSFHHLHPTHAVILNIEADHLDMYSGIEEIVEAFAVFARRLPREGSLLIQHEMPHRLEVIAGVEAPVQTIGFAPQADWVVDLDGPRVTLTHEDHPVAQWRNPMPGEHMAYNAAVAAVLAHQQGATWDAITDALESFQGLDRRMQALGTRALPQDAGGGSVRVIDDYGHHPTEIDTTLRALRRHYQPRRLICVFQPHQHSRTRFLMEQFATSFNEADIVIVPAIYFVRDSDQERQAVTARDLVDRLCEREVQAQHIDAFEAIVAHLHAITRDGDLVVTMGAGNVWQVAQQFLRSTP